MTLLSKGFFKLIAQQDAERKQAREALGTLKK